MITRKDVTTYSFKKSSLKRVLGNARLACRGNTSQVRDGESRQENLMDDQLSGQLCHYAASKHSFVWFFCPVLRGKK